VEGHVVDLDMGTRVCGRRERPGRVSIQEGRLDLISWTCQGHL
jgi:hypothetical protein